MDSKPLPTTDKAGYVTRPLSGDLDTAWERSFAQSWPKYFQSVLQKQQHMTPISINDPQLAEKIAKAMNNGILPPQDKVDFIRHMALPILESQGIRFCMNTSEEALSESGRKTVQDHMRTDTSDYGHMKYKDHGVQNLQSKTTREVAGKEFGTMVKSPVTVFGIGTAVEAAELHRKKVARRDWNGKDMYVYYVPAGNWPAVTDIAKQNFGETVPYNHYLAIKNVDGTVSPWAPSVSDALAKDWYVVD